MYIRPGSPTPSFGHAFCKLYAWRNILLNYITVFEVTTVYNHNNCGGKGGIWTHGRFVSSAVFKTAVLNHSTTFPYGAPDRTRTYNLMFTKHLRCQLRHRSMLVGMTGFEPATPWSQITCATKLRYIPKLVPPKGLEPLRNYPLDPKSSVSANSTKTAFILNRIKRFGGSAGVWTQDQSIMSTLLFHWATEP